MTYRPAILYPGAPAHPEPRIYCDGEGCTASVTVRPRGRSAAPAWFLAGKPPPGWRQEPVDDRNRHFCPKCKGAPRG